MTAIKIIQVAENRYRIPAIDNRIRAGRAMFGAVMDRFGPHPVTGTIETVDGDLVSVKFDAMGWETNRPL